MDPFCRIKKDWPDGLGGAIQEKVIYRDPSHWRKIVNLRLTDEDKKHNKMVSKGLIKGRLTAKHLSVRKVNELYNLELILKDNNRSGRYFARPLIHNRRTLN